MAISKIKINGTLLSKNKKMKGYRDPLRPCRLYHDGTEKRPFHCDMGYGFLETNSLKVFSEKNTWIPVSDFNLPKLPVKVEGVYRVNPMKNSAKLIGHNYYLIGEDPEPITSLYYFESDSLWEDKTNVSNLSDNLENNLLIYDNSFSSIHEKLRDCTMPEWHFMLRRSHESASADEVQKYEEENRDALENFYNYYYELKNKVSHSKRKKLVL